jgi:hypothetical protein
MPVAANTYCTFVSVPDPGVRTNRSRFVVGWRSLVRRDGGIWEGFKLRDRCRPHAGRAYHSPLILNLSCPTRRLSNNSILWCRSSTRPGQPRRRFSLDEVRILLNALGDPQRLFPSVLIAGTNGKGSTASTLASILSSEAGLRTGLYTSPHLERPNERIRLGAQKTPLRSPTKTLPASTSACTTQASSCCFPGASATAQLFRNSHSPGVPPLCREQR